MAGSLSNYLENKLLDHLLGGPAYTRPATIYLALFTVAPGESGGGTEVSASGYARCAVTNNDTNWPGASAGAKSNGTAMAFPEAAANWGSIVAVGIFDAASAGNLLFYSTFDAAVDISNGVTARFGAGQIALTIN
jgi:hypothetical protein